MYQVSLLRIQVYDAFYKLTNSEDQIRSYVFDNVRARCPFQLSPPSLLPSTHEISIVSCGVALSNIQIEGCSDHAFTCP